MRACLSTLFFLTACTGTDDPTLENEPPTCVLNKPLDGTHGREGESVVLGGTAADPDQAADSLSVSWSSDQDGDLGGAAPSSDGALLHTIDSLSLATHVLTLTVTDDQGATCTDAVLFSVGTPPVVVLESPEDAAVVRLGEAVGFIARVTTESGSAGDVTLDWSSDLDGSFSTEGPDSGGLALLNTDSLSGGDHVITVTATAPDGLYGVDWLNLDVNTPPGAAELAVSPDGATTADELWAVVLTDATDADGDAVTLLWSWDRDGAAVSRLDEASVPADETQRGQVWTVTATSTDGKHEGESAQASVTLVNALPTIGALGLSPEAPVAGDTLVCAWEDFEDADNDTDVSTVAWTLDGVSGGSDPVLGQALTRGETWTCTVTPHDGLDPGVPVDASVTVGNSWPSISSVSISPDTVTASDTLSCAWSGWSDPDDDADDSLVSWTVDGTEVGTDTTLSGVFTTGQTVTCTVTPHDGTDSGTALSASKTVSNSTPSLVSASITPDPASGSDTLTCTGSGWSDPDGDSDQSVAVWTVDGANVGTGSNLSTGFAGGDTVTCTLTPYDGTDTGDPVSASVDITNGTPSVSDVAINPDPAFVGDTLTCGWTYSDSDGDPDASTVAWTLNGGTAGSSDTLGSSVVRDDLVSCTVTPSDGTATGTPRSDNLTVSNSTPSLVSVQIVPTAPIASDTLSCLWSGWSDADGDSDGSTVQWSVNGTSVGTDTTLSSGFGAGDRVTCTVTPFDGTDSGSLLSDEVTAANSPPVLESVAITPDPATASDTLTCEPGTTTDADGTTVFTYTWSWTLDGSQVGTGETLSGAFARDDEVICTATPSDGTDSGTTVASDALTIENAPPSVDSVSLTPSDPTTDEVVAATVTTSDPDGDTVTLIYTWTVDGSTVGETGSSLDGASAFSRDQVIGVSVVGDDGTDSGDAVEAATVTVANSAPGAPTVSLSPDPPTEGVDDLFCSIGQEAEDDDGDTLTYALRWTVDGTAIASTWDTGDTGVTVSLTTNTWQDDTVPASEMLSGEVWTCTATADDGTDSGGSGSASTTVDAEFGLFAFASSQTIDGNTVTCSSTTTNSSYTECQDLQAGGLFFPNGIECGPTWSTTNSSYSDTQGFCQSLTGSTTFEVYYNCADSITRATWYSHSWGTTTDNGFTEHVRCYY
jgi:hypothetical protein